MDLQTMSLADLHDLARDLEHDIAVAGEDGNGMDVDVMAASMLEAVEAEIQRRWGLELGECS